jgi:hypothetical protein
LARPGPWIDPLPDGLDTHVGEQGERLFGWPTPGVPVRSAQPSVLILDELTAFDQVYVLDSGRVVGCCDLLLVTNGTGADVSHPP